jgi:hypothetical protein
MKALACSIQQTSLTLLMLALFCSTPVNAYSILEQSELDLNLPPGWKLLNISRSPGMIITDYGKQIAGTDLAEGLVEAEMTKKKGLDPNAVITEMTNQVNKQALTQHCDAQDVEVVPQDNGQFKVWRQTFQCKASQSGIIQLYIDADPDTMYLFTYTSPHYPFTSELRDTANQLLKNSIQVCYKGKSCVSAN